MGFLQILRCCIYLNILKSITTEDKNMKNSSYPHLKPLMHKERILKDVYVTKDYDANIAPKDRSLAWVSYEISPFLC